MSRKEYFDSNFSKARPASSDIPQSKICVENNILAVTVTVESDWLVNWIVKVYCVFESNMDGSLVSVHRGQGVSL